MRWSKIYYNRYNQRYEFVLEEITEKSNEHIRDFVDILDQLENGEKSVDDVDWAGELWEIVNINELMGIYMQSYCWLYPLMARLKDYDVRIDVLEHLKEFSMRYFSAHNMISFLNDCDAMITVIQHIKQFPIPDYMLRQHWYDEKQWMKELALAYTQTNLAPRMLMALAQERYDVDANGIRVDKMPSIVLGIGYLKKFTIDNCVDLCKYIFVAEGYRQYLICGDPGYNETPTLKTLNRKLRNACFDIYIQTRFEALLEEMDADNTRLLDPSDIEVYNRLYDEECIRYEQAKMDNSVSDDVLILVSYWLKYLKWKMPCLFNKTDLGENDRSCSVDRGILAVFKSGICDSADWAAVVKILEERNLVQKSAYESDASRINETCGVNVTNANSIARSVCMSKIKGTYPNWEIRTGEETRETPNKLKHYMRIAGIFVNVLDS